MTNNNYVLLKVHDLKTEYFTREGRVKTVEDVSFEVKKGEIFGLADDQGVVKAQRLVSNNFASTTR